MRLAGPCLFSLKRSVHLLFSLGFTALCETFSNKAGKDVSCGTDQLTHTLNTYIGKIVEGLCEETSYKVKSFTVFIC